MTGTHDPSLVALSILIAILASSAALDLADRIRASTGAMKGLWLGAAAVVMGGGIWSMHFVAMLAFRMPGMAVSYAPALTTLSLLLAILVTGIGFAIMTRWQGSPVRLGAAGLFTGLGIVAMHYVGMAAMRMPAALSYEPAWVAISVVIAIGAATAAFWLASRDRYLPQRAVAAVVMGCAIAGMHYAGMAGARFTAIGVPLHGDDAGVSQTALAMLVSGATLLILLVAFLAATFDRRLSQASRSEARAALRVDLADGMRGETTDEALRRASALMGAHFRVTRAGYGQFDPTDDVFDYNICWTDGNVPPLLGRYPSEAVKIVAELNAGRTVAIDDLMTSPLAGEAETRHTALALTTRSILIVPFTRNGRLRTVVYLHDRSPRRWQPDEVRFMEEMAERTRQAVARAEAESDLRALNATLEARVEERTASLQAAEAALRQSQKMEGIGQLTGGLAHDFNNMLAGVIGNLELVRRRLGEGRIAEVERNVEAASAAAQRAAALTARLLAFARRQPLDSRPVDVGELIRAMDDLLHTSLGDHVMRTVDAPDEPVHAMADPNQLENAILNLAINARDAMDGGGMLAVHIATIHVDADHPLLDLPGGRYAEIAVSDTGAGMAPEIVERVVEPFFTTKPAGQGTGLGLSMVYGFVRQSGGQVRIESSEGAGTTVTLYLPAA